MPETNFARARAAPLSVDITLYYSDPRISLESRNRNKKKENTILKNLQKSTGINIEMICDVRKLLYRGQKTMNKS